MPRHALAAIALIACAHTSASPPTALVPRGTPDSVNVAAARARGLRPLVSWSPWSRDVFERARRERRPILLDGSAAWCHWCHVMDAITYADPGVARRIAERFVAVRFDAEARPDLATRYAAYGWPATIVLSPDGVELDKRRGYLTPAQLNALLDGVLTRPSPPATSSTADPPPAEAPLSAPELAAIAPWIAHGLDAVYDPAMGSWGTHQKLSIGDDVTFELRRAAHDDATARERALFTLRQQRALYDPVWGGVYQYSAGSTWTAPHFEKLMTFQAPALEATAYAYALTRDASFLADARAIASYMRTHLTDADGAFLPTQDADVNAHDERRPFIDGHVFFAADGAHRRALGAPRVDPHVYARENGLAIASLATLYAAAPDEPTLAAARRAADLLARTHLRDDGGVVHEAPARSEGVRYLADAAALGRGYVRLAEVLPVASPDRARYIALAARIAAAALRDLRSPSGALFEHTGDPAAPGALSTRITPEEENILAARFFTALSRLDGDTRLRDAAVAILAVMTRPEHVAERGRFVGDLLLALDEAGLVPWSSLSPGGFTLREEHATLTATLRDNTLRVSLRADGTLHVNEQYPASLSLEARDATVPATLRRADAESVTAETLSFRVALRDAGPHPAIRVRFRYALCGAESCQPEERWLVVTTPATPTNPSPQIDLHRQSQRHTTRVQQRA